MADGGTTIAAPCTECGARDHAVEACPIRSHIEQRAQLRRAREAQQRNEATQAQGRGPGTIDDAVSAVIARVSSIAIASPEQLAALDASAARQAWGERLEASGIHAATRAEDRRLLLTDQLDPSYPALIATRTWLVKALRRNTPGRNVLVLAGSTGLGKTLAAAWAISREGGIYLKVDELVRDYARWDRDRTALDATTNVWRRYQRTRLVVLDEVGRERDASLMRDAFYKLVDERQSRRRQLTIMVTNLSAEDFKARLRSGVYDERSYSRLARDAWVVDLEGQDRRERTW